MTTLKDRTPLDVFATACEGGINYWAHFHSYHWIKDSANMEPDYEGFEARIRESGYVYNTPDQGMLTINRDVICTGVTRLFNKITDGSMKISPYHAYAVLGLNAVINHGADADLDYDADTADMIVQMGLFDEVIYG